MSLTLTSYIRRVYSIMDVIGDIGGLLGAFAPICIAIVRIFHHRSAYMFLAGELFGSAQANE